MSRTRAATPWQITISPKAHSRQRGRPKTTAPDRLNGGVEWRDPPGHVGPGPVAIDADVPRLLRARAGQWAMIRECSTVGAAKDYAKSRRAKWGDEYEITTRGREVFARYVWPEPNK